MRMLVLNEAYRLLVRHEAFCVPVVRTITGDHADMRSCLYPSDLMTKIDLTDEIVPLLSVVE